MFFYGTFNFVKSITMLLALLSHVVQFGFDSRWAGEPLPPPVHQRLLADRVPHLQGADFQQPLHRLLHRWGATHFPAIYIVDCIGFLGRSSLPGNTVNRSKKGRVATLDTFCPPNSSNDLVFNPSFQRATGLVKSSLEQERNSKQEVRNSNTRRFFFNSNMKRMLVHLWLRWKR